MPTDTFPVAADANDGWGGWVAEQAGGGLWPPAGSPGSHFETDAGLGFPDILVLSKREIYEAMITCLRFDTSTIPDTAVIASANLELYAVSRDEFGNNYNMVGDYYDYGGSPLVAGDWIETASPSIFTAVDITGLTLSAVNTITLTDLTGINKTGFTGIRLTLSAGTPTVANVMRFASREHATGQEPRLIVDYTTIGPGASKGLGLLGAGG